MKKEEIKKKKNKKKNNVINNIFSKSSKYYITIILLLPAIIYFKTIFYDYTGLDDKTIIVQNNEIFKDVKNIGKIITTDAFLNNKGVFYRPIQNLTFLFEAQIAGTNPYLYHLNNIILHCLACLLIFLVLIKLKFSESNSFIFCLIYGVNPLFVHAVAWIPARNDLLIAVFCLLSFLYYLKYSEKNKTVYFIIHLLSFILALFSKETVVLFPIIIILYQILFKIKNKSNIKFYFGWTFVIVSWLLVRTLSIGYDFSSVDASITVLLKNLLVIPEVISKFIIPYNLPVLSVFNLYRIIIGIIAIIFLAIYIKGKKENNNLYIILGAIWFLILILPGSFARHPYADQFYDYLDHRSYLPMFGIIIIMISLIKNDILLNKKRYMLGVFGVIIVLFSIITFSRIDNYKNSISFWEKAIKDNPNKSMSYSELGINYQKIGKNDSAEKYLQLSRQIYPEYYNNYRALGQLYSDKKDYNNAIAMLKKSIELKPEYADQKLQLGFAYYQMKDYQSALKEWNDLKNITGENKALLINLFEVYFALNSLDTAEVYANKLVAFKEAGPIIKLYSELFKRNYLNKNYIKAIDYGSKLKVLNAGNIAIYKNLSTCYTEIGDKKNAENILTEAIKKFPNTLQIYYIVFEYYLKENNYIKAKNIADNITKLGGSIDPQAMQLINK